VVNTVESAFRVSEMPLKENSIVRTQKNTAMVGKTILPHQLLFLLHGIFLRKPRCVVVIVK
jgi:hypothetical protein